MITKETLSLGGIAINEIFSYLNLRGSSLAFHILNKVFEKRSEEAREILLKEISQGGAPEMSEDDAIYIIYRYLRAAQEGAAKTNLNLLAKVISGHSKIGDLKANDFLYYADILSSLKTDEIKLIGIMVREKKTNSYCAEAVLKESFSSVESEELFQSLLRTGLVSFEQAISVEENDDYKSFDRYKSNLETTYYFTSLMEEICRFIDWENLV